VDNAGISVEGFDRNPVIHSQREGGSPVEGFVDNPPVFPSRWIAAGICPSSPDLSTKDKEERGEPEKLLSSAHDF
jgi:hypothetical protein